MATGNTALLRADRQWVMTRQRRQVLEALSYGPCVDMKSGRATSILMARLGRAPGDNRSTQQAMTQLLGDMDAHGKIVRVIDGKRTKRIALAPGVDVAAELKFQEVPGGKVPSWVTDPLPVIPPPGWRPPKPKAPEPASEAAGWDSPEPALRLVDSSSGVEWTPRDPAPIAGDDLFDPAAIAGALLSMVIDRLAEPDLVSTQQRLGSTLEENNRLRRSNSELVDEVRALKVEVVGLRRQKQELLAQVDRVREAAEKQGRVILNDEQRKVWKRLMEEVPNTRG